MGMQDTMPCQFSCHSKRFGIVYYFLKPNNHGEGDNRKRTLENLDELIRTNMTPDGGNLPTKLPPNLLASSNETLSLKIFNEIKL